MLHRRPSPALVVSIVALVVASSGTAVAASHYLITNSKQIKNGVITGADIRNGSLTGHDIKPGSIDASELKASLRQAATTPPTKALEAYRKTGPQVANGGEAKVATLTLDPGAYALFAKVNMTPDVQDNGLLNTLFKQNKTIEGRCVLDVSGDQDQSAGALVSPGSQNVLMLEMQITRTLAAAGQATLTCNADDVNWHASDASIIALPVGDATRYQSTP